MNARRILTAFNVLVVLLVPVVLAVLAALTSGCSERPRARPDAHIEIGATTHDFGPLWVGEVVHHPFVVKNVGTLPLQFGDVRSTCGCLLSRISTRQVAPGASAEITAELHADKGLGTITKMLRIGTNDPERPWLELALTAELRLLYQLDPPLLDAQDLVLGEPRDLVVMVAGTDGSELRFGSPSSPEKGFTATARTLSATDAELVVRFEGATLPGRRLFHVSLPTGHPRVTEALIPVQAVVLPRLVVEPADRVDFGVVPRAVGARVELRVRHRGATPLAIAPTASVELSKPRQGEVARPAAQITTRVEPLVEGREWKVLVEIAPASPGSTLVGRVSVLLDEPLEPPHTLVLTGRIAD